MTAQIVSKQDVCRFYKEDFWGELSRRYRVQSRLAYFLFGRPRYRQFRTSRFEVLRLDTRRYQRRRRLTRSQIRFLNMEKARLYFLDLGYHALRHMLMVHRKSGRHPGGRWSDRFVTFRDQLTLRFDHLVFLSGLAQSLGQARRFIEKGFFKINNAYLVQHWHSVPLPGDEITVRRPVFKFMLRHLRRQRYHRRRNIFVHYGQRRFHYLWSRYRRRWRSLRPRRLIRRGVFRVLNVRRAYRRFLRTKSARRHYLSGAARWRKVRAPHSVALEAFMGPSLSRILTRVLRGTRLLPRPADRLAYQGYTNRFALTRFILNSIRHRLITITRNAKFFRHGSFRLGTVLSKFFRRRLKFGASLPSYLKSIDSQLGLLESSVEQLTSWCDSFRTGFTSSRLGQVRRLLWVHRQRRRSRLFLASQVRFVSKAKPENPLPVTKLTRRWKRRLGYLDNLARFRFLRSINKLAPITPSVRRKGMLPPRTLHARFYPGSWPNRPGYRPRNNTKGATFSVDVGLAPSEPVLSALTRLKVNFFRSTTKKVGISLVSKSNLDLARIAWLGQPASLITGRPLYISKQRNFLNSSFRSRLPRGFGYDVFGKDEVPHLSDKKSKPSTPAKFAPGHSTSFIPKGGSKSSPSVAKASSKWKAKRPLSPRLANWFRVLPVPKSRLFIRSRLDNALLQSQFSIINHSANRSDAVLGLALTVLHRLQRFEKSLVSEFSDKNVPSSNEAYPPVSPTELPDFHLDGDLINAIVQSRSNQFRSSFKDIPLIVRRRPRPLNRTVFKLQRRARRRRLNTLALRRFPRFLVSYGLLRFFYLGNRQRRRRREWSSYYFPCKFNLRSFITFYGGRRKLKPIDRDLDVYVSAPRRPFNRFYEEKKPVLTRGNKT